VDTPIKKNKAKSKNLLISKDLITYNILLLETYDTSNHRTDLKNQNFKLKDSLITIGVFVSDTLIKSSKSG